MAVLAIDPFTVPSLILHIISTCKRLAKEVVVYVDDIDSQLAHAIASQSDATLNAGRPRAIRADGSGGGVIVERDAGCEQSYAFIVHEPRTQQASSLPASLGLEMTEDGNIRVQAPFYESSVPGVFAVGDCASRDKFFALASVAGSFAGAGAGIQLQTERTDQPEGA